MDWSVRDLAERLPVLRYLCSNIHEVIQIRSRVMARTGESEFEYENMTRDESEEIKNRLDTVGGVLTWFMDNGHPSEKKVIIGIGHLMQRQGGGDWSAWAVNDVPWSDLPRTVFWHDSDKNAVDIDSILPAIVRLLAAANSSEDIASFARSILLFKLAA